MSEGVCTQCVDVSKPHHPHYGHPSCVDDPYCICDESMWCWVCQQDWPCETKAKHVQQRKLSGNPGQLELSGNSGELGENK